MSARPVSVLIAALGGEGGGVLTDWIIAAAASCDLPVQSTSIPGVAQRTGATTYYIEIVPTPWRELGGRRPVLALSPGVGDIDPTAALRGRATGLDALQPEFRFAFAEFALGREVVHQLKHQIFEDHAQAARADLALQGQVRDGFERIVGESQAHVFKFE